MEKADQNIFSLFGKAFFAFKDYHLFRNLSNGKVFLYVLLISLISYLLTFAWPMGSLFAQFGSLESITDEYVPEFTLSRDGFYCEEEYYIDQPDALLVIDCNAVYSPQDLYGYPQGVIMDAEKMMSVTNNSAPSTLYYSELEEFSLSKADIYSFLPALKVIIFVTFILTYVIYCVSYLFGSLMCCLIAMIINSVLGTKLLFGDLFRLTVYARTIPVILKGVISAVSVFSLPFMLFYVIFIVLMVYVLNTIKSMDGTILATVDGAPGSNDTYSVIDTTISDETDVKFNDAANDTKRDDEN